MIKLPWELITPFQDLLRNLPNWTTSNEDEDNDDEELEAYEDSIQRLRVRVSALMVIVWLIRTTGSRRRHETDDQGAVCVLLGMPSGVFYVSQV